MGWKKNLLVVNTKGNFDIERENWKQGLNEGVVFVAGSHSRSKIVAAIRDSNEIKFKRFDWFAFSLTKWTWSVYLYLGEKV